MLETQRLILKVATLEEAPLLVNLNNDPDVVRYTGEAPFQSLVDAQTIIRDRMMDQFQNYRMGRFSVYLKDGTYIGWCGLRFFPETEEVDLGYRFLKKDWGQGYASEASERCLRYGFEELNIKKIIARAMPENIASIKVTQKLKMTFRGLNTDPTEPHNFILYDITAEEFHKCRE